jgi:hypothetical protein
MIFPPFSVPPPAPIRVMKLFHPAIALLLATLPALAQSDSILKINGETIDGVKVQSFDIRELKYQKGAGSESLPTDQVAKVELGRLKDVYRRGFGEKDAKLMVGEARNQLAAKNNLMAQFGFVEAARMFLDYGGNENVGFGFDCLNELQKGIPDAGLLPEIYRIKFEYYMGAGSPDALVVAKKYRDDSVGSGWPIGLSMEGEFYVALADKSGDQKTFQGRMREVLAKALGTQPQIANRANVMLAHSLRETGETEGARKIYDDVAGKDAVDQNSRAGAYIGLGHLKMAEGTAANKAAFREALLLFLRVRLETKDCWGSLQAEALYNAMLAAEKWGGDEASMLRNRCGYLLKSEFAGSEYAERLKGR